MNSLLQLKGSIEQRSNPSKPGPANLPTGGCVTKEHILELAHDLSNILNNWDSDAPIDNILIDVVYGDVTAKSNRVAKLLSEPGGDKPDRQIVGARFESKNAHPHHVITHYVTRGAIRRSIGFLNDCASEVGSNPHFKENVITDENLKDINTAKYSVKQSLSKSAFAKIIKDSYYVKSFCIPKADPAATNDNVLVTFFDVGKNLQTLFEDIGLKYPTNGHVDRQTLLLSASLYERLRNKVPYLVSMSTPDLSLRAEEGISPTDVEVPEIPLPQTEPTIGVIDTDFSESAYVHDWVEIDTNFNLEQVVEGTRDFDHGTEVTSLIVDGPGLNPEFDDGCGRFRVRHFPIATKRTTMTRLLGVLDRIVVANPDIKVWNISLGTEEPVSNNSISPVAALLDKIQFEHDVIFVIAGTNQLKRDSKQTRLGSPADSINSIVVNSCRKDGTMCSYSRSGPVLSFFHKPDISYYGGDVGEEMHVCAAKGVVKGGGTSFAAPWISRKLAYLIYVMGFSRESAKALLIDSTTDWSPTTLNNDFQKKGYGIAPIRIEQILETPNDTIRFIISGSSEKYDTYTYTLPIPSDKSKHPFLAKATLCYFPMCDRNQGVDYTDTELDLHFGRIRIIRETKLINDVPVTTERKRILSVDGNIQTEPGSHNLYEANVREHFRKWDNVKHISDVQKKRMLARKQYNPEGYWGLSIKTKERLSNVYGKGLHFAVVVTLKEMFGKNRIEDFIQQCSLRGWLVTRISQSARIEVFEEAEQQISFE
ncbi:MAG: S8 family peptidase [Bifidobacterium crudilactis]